MVSNSAPEIRFELKLPGMSLVKFRYAGRIWRLGSTAPDWQATLDALPELRARHGAISDGVWLGCAGDGQAPLIAMCCGLGSVWPGMGRELYAGFPAAAEAMDAIARLADWDVLGLMDETGLDKISQTRWQIPYLFMLEYAQWSLLRACGLKPDLLCGHSLGELIALCFAGVYSLDAAWHLLDTRAEHMAELESRDGRSGGMLAVPADYAEIARILEKWPDLKISNRNTDRQYILGGPRGQLLEARRELRRKRVPAIMLNMDLAFHNPAMRILRDMSLRRLNGLQMRPPELPVISCVDGLPYPGEKSAICVRIADLDENTVDWVGLIKEMRCRHPDGAFLEFGPQETLCGITGELSSAATCIPIDKKSHEIEAMRLAICQLFALGYLNAGDIMAAAGNAMETSLGYAPPTRATPGDEDALEGVSPQDQAIVLELVAEAACVKPEDIRPHMDLRHDLAVRSSHFPFLMLEAERRLGRSVNLENLFHIVTVADLVHFLSGTEKPASPGQVAAAGPRTLFLAARRPLRRYSLTESEAGVAFIPASLDPCRLARPEWSIARICARIADPGLRPFILDSLELHGSLIEDMAGKAGAGVENLEADAFIIAPPPVGIDGVEAGAASAAADLRNLKAGSRACVLQRFVLPDDPGDWRKSVTRWHEALRDALPSGVECRCIALLEGRTPTHNRVESSDWLVAELLHGQGAFVVWDRLPGSGGAPLFCNASDIFRHIFPDDAVEIVPDGSVFHGLCQYSAYADTDLRLHGADAMFSPLDQYLPPEPLPASPWLPLGNLLDTMQQAAHVSVPWLLPIGFGDVRIFRLPSLPDGITRECRLAANARLGLPLEGVGARIARIAMDLAGIAPNGRRNGGWQPIADGRCILGAAQAAIPPLWAVAEDSGVTLPPAYLEAFYTALGLGAPWRVIREMGLLTRANMATALLEPPLVKNGKKSQFQPVARILDASFLGAMAALAAGAPSAGAVAEKLAFWRFSAIGFIRFDMPRFERENRGVMRLVWHLSWKDDKLTRYDVQATLDNEIVLTIQNLEFERTAALPG